MNTLSVTLCKNYKFGINTENISNIIEKLLEKKINHREEILKIYPAEEIPEESNKMDVSQ